jgi:molybdopterin synthase sulfur carrier subunit
MITIKLVYLARLREVLGCSEEKLTLDQPTPTIANVIDILRERNATWAYEFGKGRAVRAAINFNMAEPDTMLNDEDELAFFPPVTGG